MCIGVVGKLLFINIFFKAGLRDNCVIWGFVLTLFTVSHLDLDERTNYWGPSSISASNSAEL